MAQYGCKPKKNAKELMKSLQTPARKKQNFSDQTNNLSCKLRRTDRPFQATTLPEDQANIIPERQESPVCQNGYRRDLHLLPRAIKVPAFSTATTSYFSSSLNPFCCDPALVPHGLTLVMTRDSQAIPTF